MKSKKRIKTHTNNISRHTRSSPQKNEERMFLRAYIDNKEIISIDQTKKQWKDLKKRLKSKKSVLTLPCCMQEGVLKANKGINYFVHAKLASPCEWKPESFEHLKAKIEIMETCRKNGWKTIPEFSKKNWRADVLAIKNDKKIAFDVQWRQKHTYPEISFLPYRYKESNIHGCHFLGHVRGEGVPYAFDTEIPTFAIYEDTNSNIKVQQDFVHLSLKSFVGSFLNRKLKLCEHVRLKSKQEVTIIFFDTICWKCHKSQHVWTIEQDFLPTCHWRSDGNFIVWNDNYGIDKSPKIYEAVKQFLKTENGKHLLIGQLRKRYSQTNSDDYLAHGCFYCDAVFGDFFINPEKEKGKCNPNSIQHNVKIEFEMTKVEKSHWCYSENRNFCE